MQRYPESAWERAMKIQEVILRAMAKKSTWGQAAEIIGISDRQMRRWTGRYEEHGYDGLFDRRRGKPGPNRVPLKEAEEVLRLYRGKYADLNVRHFHEKLREAHGIKLSYTWVKLALQGAGLVAQGRKRGVHRKRRARRPRWPLPGILLHLDGSRHQWFQDDRWYDLIEVLDDATSETYYAQLVEEESTRTVMTALLEVIERKGRFSALYSDRASHFFETPAAGGAVSLERLTQVGRAAEGVGNPDDPGLLAAGARPQRATLCDLARAAAARAAFGRDRHRGGSQPLSAHTLHRENEPPVQRAGGAAGRRLRAPARPGPGPHFLRAARTNRGQGQHRAARGSGLANWERTLARYAGRLPCHHLRAPGRDRQHPLWTARGGALHGVGSAAGKVEKSCASAAAIGRFNI